jgi:hypothetical protein
MSINVIEVIVVILMSAWFMLIFSVFVCGGIVVVRKLRGHPPLPKDSSLYRYMIWMAKIKSVIIWSFVILFVLVAFFGPR